jgi:hypothetical protein
VTEHDDRPASTSALGMDPGSTAPQVTDELRDRARQSPNSWVYSVDRAYDAAGAVPPYAVVGGWQVDDRGELGAFTVNPDYRPSPVALGFDPPTDPVDAALQLAATGHGPDTDVTAALAAGIVYLPVDADGGLVAHRDVDGADLVVIFTDPHQASAAAHLLATEVAAVTSTVPDDTVVEINPGSQASLRVLSHELREALRSYGGGTPGASDGFDPTPEGGSS